MSESSLRSFSRTRLLAVGSHQDPQLGLEYQAVSDESCDESVPTAHVVPIRMGRGDLSNAEWARLKPHLPRNVVRGGRWKSHRRVINGILFRQRTGIPWRDLPPRFGKWKTVYERHRRWSADGTWERHLRAVHADADTEGRIDWSTVGVDSTSCRAHQHAAGARERPPCVPGRHSRPARHRYDEALGRSRGGLTCKIHLPPLMASKSSWVPNSSRAQRA